MANSVGGSDWGNEGLRQAMVKRLDDSLRELKGNLSHSAALEMEKKAFNEASNQQEYLNSISKVINAVRTRQQQQKQQQFDGGESGNPMMVGGQPQQRPPMSIQQQQQMQMMQQQQMRPNVMNPVQGVSQLQARLQQRMPNPQMGNMAGGHRAMMPQQMMAQGGNPRMSQMSSTGTPMMAGGGMINPRGPPPMYMNANTSTANASHPPGGSPMMMSHSPSGAGQPQSQPQQAQFLQSPINQQQQIGGMPSPVNSNTGPRGLAPSPMSTSVVTPHAEAPGSVEDHQYLEKVRELGKYIEPLQRMIARIGNEDQVKLSKMKRLMDILSNPNKRMPIETLLKCGAVLKRIIVDDNIEQDGSGGGISAGDLFTSANVNPLLEAVLKLSKQQSSGAFVPLNHSLQRTLGPPLETIYGPDIGPPVYAKRRKLNKDVGGESSIPDVLQGEIARLLPHFKVNLDSSEPSGGALPLRLVCQLDDQNLPPVPAINVTIPKHYPEFASPQLFTSRESNEYKITPFFQMVEEALQERLLRMNRRHTLTQLLNAWEMSVRAVCSPKAMTSLQESTKQSVILGV